MGLSLEERKRKLIEDVCASCSGGGGTDIASGAAGQTGEDGLGGPDYGDLMQINQNANRAASLVGQLLAFSRKQNLQLETIDLRNTMGELIHLLNRLVGEKIVLELAHEAGMPPVRADKRQPSGIKMLKSGVSIMSHSSSLHMEMSSKF